MGGRAKLSYPGEEAQLRAAGDIPKIANNLMLLKGSSLVGVFWGEFVRREPKLNAHNRTQFFPGCTNARSGH